MSPQPALSDFDHALLILVATAGSGGISAYEIAELMEEGRGGLLGRSAASMYARLPKLAEQGYLDAEEVVGKRRKGAVRYLTTDTGTTAVRYWLGNHRARLPAFDDSDAFVFIRGMKVERPIVIWKGLRSMIFDIQDRLDDLESYERRVRGLNDAWAGDYSTRLEISYSRLLLTAYKTWLDEVRRILDMPDPSRADS